MKQFHLISLADGSVSCTTDVPVPLDQLGHQDVRYCELPPIAPAIPPTMTGGFLVPLGPQRIDPFINLSIGELSLIVWDTLNEYVYELVNTRCREAGYKDFYDVTDSATNTALPLAERQEASALRSWWGHVWTQAYVLKNEILAAKQTSDLFDIKHYIRELSQVQ